MRACGSCLVVLTPLAPEDYGGGAWTETDFLEQKRNQYNGHILLTVGYLPCADFTVSLIITTLSL